MKEITINYLSHNRLDYTELMFYFLSKIKPENKSKLRLNVLATHENNWETKCKVLGIDYTIHLIDKPNNYLEKIKIALTSNTEFSVKLDEDCFINNFIWDFIIENVNILNEDILALSPIMSNNIPSCDLFISDFIKDNDFRDMIHHFFLKRNMPNGLWGIDYSSLNKYTIESKVWSSKDFYNAVDNLPTLIKGIHPLRISYEAQTLINEYILENINDIISKNEYSFLEIDSPYFTNSLFFIRTNDWQNILKDNNIDAYDEIAFNSFKKNNKKKILFVKNGFGIHPMFNTIHGNNNIWSIGGENAIKEESIFYNDLKNKIIK